MPFALIRFHPEFQKTQKRVKIPRTAWRFNQSRQAPHQQTQKIVKTFCVAWRPRMCRRGVPLLGTQNTPNSMSRLAVVHHPPGGFWEIPETQNYEDINSTQTSIIPYSYTFMIICINFTKSSSPNLVLLCLSLKICRIPP